MEPPKLAFPITRDDDFLILPKALPAPSPSHLPRKFGPAFSAIPRANAHHPTPWQASVARVSAGLSVGGVVAAARSSSTRVGAAPEPAAALARPSRPRADRQSSRPAEGSTARRGRRIAPSSTPCEEDNRQWNGTAKERWPMSTRGQGIYRFGARPHMSAATLERIATAAMRQKAG